MLSYFSIERSPIASDWRTPVCRLCRLKKECRSYHACATREHDIINDHVFGFLCDEPQEVGVSNVMKGFEDLSAPLVCLYALR